MMFSSSSRSLTWFRFLVIFLSLFFAGCQSVTEGPDGLLPNGELIIFHAGSLANPVAQLSAEFQELYPAVEIQTEAAGSRTTVRKVSELDREADLVMSADYQVIDSLLIPEFASWNVLFARNSMVITYSAEAAYADEISAENWYQILLRDDTDVGRSNPQADPNGYRTLMVWQLAEIYYDIPGLAAQLEKASPPQNIRPKETDLIPLLQTGDLDYAFNYLSVALQHNLEFINLPDQINLSNPVYQVFYQAAAVQLDGPEPGETILREGDPIIYGVTIPSSAPRPDLAALFLKFLFSSRGQEILEDQGQIPLLPPLSSQTELLPENIRELVDLLGSN
ncbi:MAG: tungstate ABC transporter substrate-binding protein WtpA [Chloroflexota bacterium]|nr:MAG: tungstate ABC transporter substrate-binding protein WtpA [Chloroflexota bacterium]